MSVHQGRETGRGVTPSAPEVYSADEVARAAGVDARLVRSLVAAGEMETVDGVLVAEREAVRIAQWLRRGPIPPVRPVFGGALLERGVEDSPAGPVSVAISTLAHGVVVTLAIMLAAVQTTTAADRPPDLDRTPPPRLIFVAEPGPGGGGGGGLRQPLPPPRAERRGERRVSSPVPPRETPAVVEPIDAPPPPEPLERHALPAVVAPLMAMRADRRDLRGLLEPPPARAGTDAPSHGPGREGGVGRGTGRGVGSGSGAGVGPGLGGGAGGGPYRPGSGISPPAIEREVKPVYTADALRRGIEGDVVLEVVVLASGAVGEIRVVRSLGYGLDETAVAAMRRWRFHPAQRQGVAVDVVVEVAMEFRLR